MEKTTHEENPTNKCGNDQQQVKMNRLSFFLYGLVVGALLVGIMGWLSMPSMMLKIHQSKYDSVDETCAQLKAAIEANGWQCPAIRNLNEATAKQGVKIDKQVRIVELCKAEYAKEILETNPEVSTLMPCAWGVYEGKDGKVYISAMNTRLMGKMFGGNIAKVMGRAVSKDEEQMLKDIIQQ
ncbi:MAG TPA: DUF302 domain-containing protein [Candidatus Hydrogenedentes bacterium]|nr:DUF302 domain-containing protein [Candidatus Hydrogenedentota bacterium]HOL76714.1 DUF302 domain-containing protein [Candidatus Hydrogenedentota bacterium]HPO85325.1 DUF302 domain-containing protein [Candidatus Hydrogenedentota bacterium]